MLGKFKPYLVIVIVALVTIAILNRLSSTNPLKKAVVGGPAA